MSFKETRHFVPQVLAYKQQFASVDTGKVAEDMAATVGPIHNVDYDELKKTAGIKD